MSTTKAPSSRPMVSIADLAAMRTNAQNVVATNRADAAAPSAEKLPPEFNALQLAELCGIERSKFEHRRRKGGLPDGREEPRRRVFTLSEAHEWLYEFRSNKLRQSFGKEKTKAAVITVGMFKGGVGKTTTAATLAQGLSLRGHKVLVIDTDPQGSLTSLMGIAPESLLEENTVMGVVSGDSKDLLDAVEPTYWDNLHIVGASPLISAAQFYLPARVSEKDGKKTFWTVLLDSMESITQFYDVVVIDSPPALDYLTMNAFYAADILISPIPPSAMDLVSSTQFWDLFVDLFVQFKDRGMDKDFSFVNVLLSRVDTNDSASNLVREWISESYGKYLMPVEIPTTAAAKTAAAEFGTVYDATAAQLSARTYRRAYDAYERMVDIIEDQIHRVWQSQVDSFVAPEGASK